MHSFANYPALNALLSYVFGAAMHSFSTSLSLLGIPSRSKRQCHAFLSYISGSLTMQFFLKCPAVTCIPEVFGAIHCFSYIGCRHVKHSLSTSLALPCIPSRGRNHCHEFISNWCRHAFLSSKLTAPCIPFRIAATAMHSFPRN
jgi:hypothetical protein